MTTGPFSNIPVRPVAPVTPAQPRGDALPARADSNPDRIELSDHVKWLDELRRRREIRDDLVARVRDLIVSGVYESEAKLDAAIEALVRDEEIVDQAIKADPPDTALNREELEQFREPALAIAAQARALADIWSESRSLLSDTFAVVERLNGQLAR